MNSRISMWQFTNLGILCYLVVQACASTPLPTPTQSEAKKYFIKPTKEILLLFPDVSVANKPDKKQTAPIEFRTDSNEVTINTKTISERIQTLATDEMNRKGFIVNVGEPLGIESSKLKSHSGIPESLSKRLVRPSFNLSRALELVQDACRESNTAAILVHYMELVGIEEGWTVKGLPPLMFGMVPHAGLQTSHIRAALRDCGTGEILWQNEAFIREIPVNNPTFFDEVVKSLYQNLSAN